MRWNLFASLVFAIAVPACGGGDDGGDDTADDSSGDDSSGQPDAPSSTEAVVSVTCPADGAEDGVVTTSGSSFDPQSTTIAVDGIVKFAMISGSGHNVVSTTSGESFSVDFGETACFQFAEAGTYTFKCSPHGFTGSVVVQ